MRQASFVRAIFAVTATTCLCGAVQAADDGPTIGIAAFHVTESAAQEHEPGLLVWNGAYVGASWVFAQTGPLHYAGWDCTGELIAQQGIVQVADGFCLVTDPDGDTVNLRWEVTNAPLPFTDAKTRDNFPKTKGTYISGTGKHAGIDGAYTFSCHPGIANGMDICEIKSQ